MLVTLHNFKCYQQERTFKLSNGINLLKGVSGKGKSTVLNAISWCLYGGIVKDLEGKKRKSYVRLEIDNLSISRYKNPSLLVININNTKYEGDSAQAIINSKFGSKTIFMCSGYLMQGERNSLISLSDKEKIDILNSFAFRDEDPSQIIQKIKNYLDRIEGDYITLNNQYQIKYGIYIKWADSVKLNNLSKPEFDNDKLLKLINDAKQELESTNKRIQESDRKKWQQNQLNQTLSKLECELKSIGNQFGEVSLEDLESTISKLRSEQLISIQHNNVVDNYNHVKSQLDQYNGLPEDSSYLSLDVNRLKYQQTEYSHNLKIANDLKVSYDAQSIESKISTIQRILDGQRNAQIKQELTVLSQQLNGFNKIATIEEVSECERILKSVTERSVYLTCPHCNNSVQHVNHQLVKQSESPTTQEEVKVCRSKLLLANQQYQEGKQKQTIQLRITTLEKLLDPQFDDIQLLKTYEATDLRKQINRLQSIKILDPVTIDPNVVEKVQKRHQLTLQLDKIRESSKYDVTTRLDNPQDKINQMEHIRKTLIEQTTRKSIIESNISDTKIKLDKLGPVEDINRNIPIKLTDTITKYQEDIHINNVINDNTKYQAEINNIVNQSNSIRKDHECGKKLLETAKQLERLTLQHVIDMINVDIADILNVIFSDPITVSLELFRETKDHQIKPTVNIKINYRGIEYSKVSELSGGEIDRISLALTIALNRISHCPIMLLDEVLSSLDMNAKESCLGIIKQYSSQKIVNCIDHEGVDGLYTDIVNFE